MDGARTHEAVDGELCGRPLQLSPGHAVVELATTARMAADARGLVHGGFVFGAVDYAAMLAVNDPLVVLGAADVKFVGPVRVGQRVLAHANVLEQHGRKRVVRVEARVASEVVLDGTLTAFVLDAHVLDRAR